MSPPLLYHDGPPSAKNIWAKASVSVSSVVSACPSSGSEMLMKMVVTTKRPQLEPLPLLRALLLPAVLLSPTIPPTPADADPATGRAPSVRFDQHLTRLAAWSNLIYVALFTLGVLRGRILPSLMGCATILVLHLVAFFACCNGISTTLRQGSTHLACPGLKCLPEAGHRDSWWGRRRSYARATGSELLLAASGLTRLRGGCTDASGAETGSPGEAGVAEGGDDDGAAEVLAEGGEHAVQGRPEDDARAEASREPEVEKTEGLAKFHFRKGEVFYNKAQVVNRDLSVLVISSFVETRQKEMQEERERRMRNREAAAAAAEVIGGSNITDGPAEKGHSVEAAAGGGIVKVGDQGTAEREGHADATSTRANIADAPPGREECDTRESGDGLGKARGVRILDALSATGLRAIRYTLEIPGVDHVVANDLNPRAVESIKRNCELNSISEDQVSTAQGDALALMMRSAADNDLFDVIDLDPFGTPAPMLSASLHAVANGGLLCITCTDMRVMTGQQPDVCFARYGGMPVRSPYSKEAAIRILLANLQRQAAAMSKVIEPVVCLSIDFYIRVFVRVRHNRKAVLSVSSRIGSAYHCRGCESFLLQPSGVDKGNNNYVAAPAPPPEVTKGCICGFQSGYSLVGPLWLGPICNKEEVGQMLESLEDQDRGGGLAASSRLTGLLYLLGSEVEAPLFMQHTSMSKVLKCNPPKLGGIRALIKDAGYNVSQSHVDPQAIKTDAPPGLIWDLLRVWVVSHPNSMKAKGADENSPGSQILASAPIAIGQSKLNTTSSFRMRFDQFDPCADRGAKHGRDGKEQGGAGKRRRMALYPQNPANWGPQKSTPTTWEVEGKDDILPGGLGIPEEAIQMKTFDEMQGQDGEEGVKHERTVEWMDRFHGIERTLKSQ